jgi:hypothetical protein
LIASDLVGQISEYIKLNSAERGMKQYEEAVEIDNLKRHSRRFYSNNAWLRRTKYRALT